MQPLTALAATGGAIDSGRRDLAAVEVSRSLATHCQAGRALTARREPPARVATLQERSARQSSPRSFPVAPGQLPARANAEHMPPSARRMHRTPRKPGRPRFDCLGDRHSTAANQCRRSGRNDAPKGPRGSTDLVLPAGRAVAWTSCVYSPVRSSAVLIGKRATVLVSQSGAKVAVEDVRIENVDFVFSRAAPDGEPESAAHDEADAGFDRFSVLAYHCEFHGCTFRSGRRGTATTRGDLVAIASSDWPTPASRRGGKLQLTDCVMSDVAAGVRCQAARQKAVAKTAVAVRRRRSN